jgi:ParB family transcriptional regulator, chromosome partitioning protein
MNSSHSRRALGRGLTNLIPVDDDRSNGTEIVSVDINAIATNPFQPRHDFDKEEISNLAQSIEKQGLLQPILLRKKGNGYEIISGERRFRAMKLLGNDKVPCIIKQEVTDHEMIEMALVENIQRENLNDIDQALAYKQLMMECGLSHDEISKKVGKSRSTITNFLRLLKLPQEVQEKLRKKELTMGHARALLSIENSEQQKILAEKIISDNLTVRDIEKTTKVDEPAIDLEKENKIKKVKQFDEKDPDVIKQEENLRYKFGTMVNILHTSNEKGKIEIHFLNSEDMNRVLEILLDNK